ncbi:MAG: hypothetical protein K0M48_07940 [Thiobacillus sp.]|nr:hypothetical protein [Thiobacillus sp.]
MQLLQLTPAEIAFLTTPSAAPDDLQARLARKLAAKLTARLRLPVQVKAMAAQLAAATDPAAPTWQPDAALATLWLTRRLGGRHMMGATPFVPRGLIQTLDAALAECWLDGAALDALPAALAWRLDTDLTQATLAVRLPNTPIDMTRWARGVIQHG